MIDKKLLSFDIEISDIFEIENGENIQKYAPFHISVASTVIDNGEKKTWYSRNSNDKPSERIEKKEANKLLEYLKGKQDEGYYICAWNGLNFDMQWIGHNADNMQLASEIAMKMYDPMFQFFNEKGFPVSLSSVGRGMGINQKKLMDGADAPKEWISGNYQKVIDYVLMDSEITNMIIKKIIESNKIAWITKKGKLREISIPRLKTVEEILQEPEPDQSWMDNKILRHDFHKWIPENQSMSSILQY